MELWLEKLVKLKLNASTTTRSTTRCSGDLMGDQINDVTRSLLGDQIDDQISLSRIDSEWSCCLLGKYQGLLNKFEQKRKSGHQSGHPGAIWSPGSDLVAHQVTGASGRRSGRGRCIQL